MVTETSKAAYASLKAKGLTAKQMEVLQAMHCGHQTRRELAKKLHAQASSIAGRVNELIELQMIGVQGTRKCTVTGLRVEALAITGKGMVEKTKLSWSPDAGQASVARGRITGESTAGASA